MINRVLVTAIGSFASDAVIRSMKEQGMFVAGCDIYPAEWVAQSLDVDVFVQAEYATKEKEYMEFLLNTCRIYDIQMIVPLTDVEVDVLNRSRRLTEEAGILVGISDETAIGLCRDKYRAAEYLADKKVCTTIPTTHLNHMKEEDWQYPAVIKPLDGRSSQGLFKVKNERERIFAAEAIEDPERYVVQPMIGGGIVTVDVVRQPETDMIVCLPRKELLRTLNGAGTSVQVFRSQKLEEQCKAIAEAIGIRGCVNFEFVEDPQGEYHFLECNPRFSGGVAFSHAAGYDMAANHLRCFTGSAIDWPCQSEDKYIARKYQEYITKEV